MRVTVPIDSTSSSTSTVKELEEVLDSESVAVIVTENIPLFPFSGVMVSEDSLSTAVAGAASPLNPVTSTSRVTSPSMLDVDIEMLCVCPLLRIKSSSGSIDGAWPRMLVSAAAALTRPPETVFPSRLWTASTVPSIALLTSVTEIPGFAALRSPTTPAT